jgi:hypothetical protein
LCELRVSVPNFQLDIIPPQTHTFFMRTTVKLEEEAREIVQLYADSNDISVSKAISELVMQAARPRNWIKYKDGIPIFDVPRGPMISDELVRQLVAEEI